jgi:hypothetical protein
VTLCFPNRLSRRNGFKRAASGGPSVPVAAADGGAVGLAVPARLQERGLMPVLLEAGPSKEVPRCGSRAQRTIASAELAG